MIQSLHALTTEIQKKLGMSVLVFLHLIAFRSMSVMSEAKMENPGIETRRFPEIMAGIFHLVQLSSEKKCLKNANFASSVLTISFIVRYNSIG